MADLFDADRVYNLISEHDRVGFHGLRTEMSGGGSSVGEGADAAASELPRIPLPD